MLSSIDALIYLHEDAQVIHCDIKPGNFLLAMGAARTGMIKVADFGMSVQSEVSKTTGLYLYSNIYKLYLTSLLIDLVCSYVRNEKSSE